MINIGGSITIYHESSMIIKIIYIVLNLGEDSLNLDRTFGDIVE